jgi:hypothetical protein
MRIRISMKTQISKNRRQGGLAVIIMLALLSIILVCVGANLKALSTLNRELKLVDQHQVRRLNALSVTNPATLAIRLAETNAPTLATNLPATMPAP